MPRLLLLPAFFILSLTSCHALLSVSDDKNEQRCGDGTISGDEVCDGTNLQDETCNTQGFTGGTLRCSSDCSAFDTTSCEGSTCGNGVLDEGETCDGTNLQGETCVTQGFSWGNLFCNSDCSGFDTSQCSNSPCGNGVLDDGEACDDGFNDDCGTCNHDCTGPGTGSTCGDGSLCPETETCDDGYTDACGTCNADCSAPGTGSTCGDGEVCPETELCDDGYTDACGSCNADCTGAGAGSLCGNGMLCPETEACDDGYNDSCGTCNADCTAPGLGAVCGDGSWCPELELCDDGDPLIGDGCDDSCQIETGWECQNDIATPSHCTFLADTCPGVTIGAGTYSLDTHFLEQDFDDYGGTDPAHGPDLVYNIEVQPGEFVRAVLHSLDPVFDGILVMTHSCPPVITPENLFSNYNNDGGVEVLHWQNDTTAAVTIYLFVDGRGGSDAGMFTLDVSTGVAASLTDTTPITFNEYKGNGPDPREEWIEFYYGGTTPVNLAGGSLVTGDLSLVFDNFIVLPGEYFLIVNNDQSGEPENPMSLYGWSAGAGIISVLSDTLTLLDPLNNTVDSIGPFSQPGWPSSTATDVSISLDRGALGDAAANDIPTNWVLTPLPSPGDPNP